MECAGDDFALLLFGETVEVDRIAGNADGEVGVFFRVMVGIDERFRGS